MAAAPSVAPVTPSEPGGVTWSRLMARWPVVSWTWLYVGAFVWSTKVFIEPWFGYYGFVTRSATLTEWLLVVEGTFLVALMIPGRCRRPSEVAQVFLTATVAVPVLWMPLLYGRLDAAQVSLLALSTTSAFGLMWLVLRGARLPFLPLKLPRQVFWWVLAVVFSGSLAYLAVRGVTPDIVGFDDVYGQRARYAEGIGTLGAYLVGWLSGGLFPVMLAVGLYRRSPTLVLASLAGVLFLYALSGQKSYALGVPIVVGTYVMTRRGWTRSWHWFGLLTLLIALIALLDRLRDSYELTSLIVRRGVSTAGINTAYYVDLFDGVPLYELRHSVLSMLGSPPYDVAPAILVGRTYYTDGTVANANFLADGFANFGWLGVLVSGLVVGVLLRLFDIVSEDIPLAISAPSLVFVLQAAANTAILTTIASHGAAVLVALVALMPASIAATGASLRRQRVEDASRRRASSGLARD